MAIAARRNYRLNRTLEFFKQRRFPVRYRRHLKNKKIFYIIYIESKEKIKNQIKIFTTERKYYYDKLKDDKSRSI